ncbi:MAG: hypothetical protein AAFX06_02010 [Planctomycetota bacterium]
MHPRRSSGFAFLAVLGVTVAGALFARPSFGDDSEPPVESTRDQYTTLDQYTAPFQMRVAGFASPIGVASATGGLTIAVRGLDESAGRSGILRVELVRVEDNKVLHRLDEKVKLDQLGNAPATTLLDVLPETPGVYEVRCRLTAERNAIWARIAGNRAMGDEKRFPLLIASADQTAGSQPNVLRPLDPVQAYDREAWHTPSWVPEGASRLVPNVNQLVADPWNSNARGSTSAESGDMLLCQIEPGGEFVCKLPDMAPHKRHLITFSVRQRHAAGADKPTAANSAAGQIEIATDPEFRTIVGRHPLSMPQHLTNADNDLERLEFVHYPSENDEFLRILNPSQRFPLAIRSVEAFAVEQIHHDGETRPVAQTGLAASTTRQVTLQVTESTWAQTATSDITGLQASGFAEATSEMYRIWKAAERIAENAPWVGYEKLLVQPRRKNEFVRSFAIESLRRWLTPYGIEVAMESEAAPVIELPALGGTESSSLARQCRAATAASELSQLARGTESGFLLQSENVLPAMTRGFRQGLREYTQLPKTGFAPLRPVDDASRFVTAFSSEIAPGSRSVPGKRLRLVSFVNLSTWRASIELRCCASGSANCERLVSNPEDQRLRAGRTSNVRIIELPPLGIVSVVVEHDGSQHDELAWRAVTDGPEVMEQIQTQVGQVVAKIGMLTQPDDYPGLRNGGFEEIGPVGIVGWMSTQFPATAVVVDPSEAVEGQQSIRMTTTKESAGQTWLVSEPIEIPQSGRLAVSLAVRAAVQLELTGSADRPGFGSSHRVRISLEGNRRGRALRYTDHIDVPRDGQWQSRRIVLETEGLDENTEFVRLTLDSLSPGQLWIDDIHLHDHFPTQAERTALQGSAFLAIQGLQKGRLQEAADLLRNDWSQHLLSNKIRRWPTTRTVSHEAASVPISGSSPNGNSTQRVQSGIGNQHRSTSSGNEPLAPDVESRPSVAERIRSWLPKPLRF